MRELTDHKVNPANDVLTVAVTDEPGSGGANHMYEVSGYEGKSGVAQYTVADMGGYDVQLRSVQDAHVVHLMLLGAYRAGMRAGQQRMRETVSRAMREGME